MKATPPNLLNWAMKDSKNDTNLSFFVTQFCDIYSMYSHIVFNIYSLSRGTDSDGTSQVVPPGGLLKWGVMLNSQLH